MQGSNPGDQSYAVSFFGRKRDVKPQSRTLSVAELVEVFKDHNERKVKDGPLWSPVRYKEGGVRRNEDVEIVSCLVGDFDNGMMPNDFASEWAPYAHILHTSFSHTPEVPKWRVIFPLAEPISPRMWLALWERAAHHLMRGLCDPHCKDLARMYFLPAHPPGAEHWTRIVDGSPLDLSKLPAAPVKEKPIILEGSWGSGQVAMEVLMQRALAKVRAGEGRHNTGLWLACQLRDNRYTVQDAQNCPYPLDVPATDTKGHVDPYTIEQWQATVRDAYSKPARDPWPDPVSRLQDDIGPEEPLDPAGGMPSYPRTDLGNAERFVYRYGQVVRHCTAWNKWLVWNGVHWMADADAEVGRCASSTIRGIWDEAKRSNDPEEQEKLAKWAIASESVRKGEAMLSWTKSRDGIPIRPSELDLNPWRLTCKNGSLNLKTGALERHSPVDYATKIVPHDYDDLAAAPLWMAFIERITDGQQDLALYLQRWFGYCLTGQTAEQTLVFAYGMGANGKSTCMETMMHVLGSGFSTKTQSQTLMLTKGERRHSADLAALRGARLVVASEISDGAWLDEALVKDLTGGDAISARYMRQDYFTFIPEFKLMMYGNHKPIIRDVSTGLWRRLHLVPFNVTIPKEERDGHLGEKLRAEAPGILAWAMRGCLSWQEQGLNAPKIVLDAIDDYRSEQDVLAEFVSDHCLVAPSAEAGRNVLYGVYRSWCADSGITPMSARRLAIDLQQRFGVTKGRGVNGARFWAGIGVKTTYDESMEATPLTMA